MASDVSARRLHTLHFDHRSIHVVCWLFVCFCINRSVEFDIWSTNRTRGFDLNQWFLSPTSVQLMRTRQLTRNHRTRHHTQTRGLSQKCSIQKLERLAAKSTPGRTVESPPSLHQHSLSAGPNTRPNTARPDRTWGFSRDRSGATGFQMSATGS